MLSFDTDANLSPVCDGAEKHLYPGIPAYT